MKRFRAFIIILLLLPVFCLQLFYARINQDRLFDLLAHQPVMVYSFVWMPLLEISVLMSEWITPSPEIAPLTAGVSGEEEQPAAPVRNDALLFVALSAGLLFAAIKSLILSALALCFGSTDDPGSRSPLPALFSFLIILPLYILRSNPALPRGDPPSALAVC